MSIRKLSIQEVLDNGMATVVVIKAEDLKQTIINTVEETKKRMERDILLRNSDVLLTSQQVLERLSISRTTLWHWVKRNYITPIEIGGKQRYKLSDVNIIIEGKNEVFKEA